LDDGDGGVEFFVSAGDGEVAGGFFVAGGEAVFGVVEGEVDFVAGDFVVFEEGAVGLDVFMAVVVG